MSQRTKIKKDHCGLYVLAGGYRARPFAGSCFKENDEVRTHHFGGSTHVGVGLSDANFRNKSSFEYWSTAGQDYEKNYRKEWRDPFTGKKCPTWEFYVGRVTQWYQEFDLSSHVFKNPHNRKYAHSKRRTYVDGYDLIHITFSNKPSPIVVERLGKGLCRVFLRNQA